MASYPNHEFIPAPFDHPDSTRSAETNSWERIRFNFNEHSLYGTPVMPTNNEARLRTCLNAIAEQLPAYAIAHKIAEYHEEGHSTAKPRKAAALLQSAESFFKQKTSLPDGVKTKGKIILDSGILPQLKHELALANDPSIQLIEQINQERGERMTDNDLHALADSLLKVIHLSAIKQRCTEKINEAKQSKPKIPNSTI